MPDLSDTTKLPGAVDPATVKTTVQLWGADEPETGRSTGPVTTIGGPRIVYGNPFTITGLIGNADLLPGGTVYRVHRTWPGLREPLVDYIAMPTSGGPYTVGAILADQPATLASAALAAHAVDTDLHGGGRLLAMVRKVNGNFTTSAFGVVIPDMDLPVTVPAKSDGTIRPYVLDFFAEVVLSGPSPANNYGKVDLRVGGAQIGPRWQSEGHSSTDGQAQRLTVHVQNEVPNAVHNPAPGSLVIYQPYAAVFPATGAFTVVATVAFGVDLGATFKAVTQ